MWTRVPSFGVVAASLWVAPAYAAEPVGVILDLSGHVTSVNGTPFGVVATAGAPINVQVTWDLGVTDTVGSSTFGRYPQSAPAGFLVEVGGSSLWASTYDVIVFTGSTAGFVVAPSGGFVVDGTTITPPDSHTRMDITLNDPSGASLTTDALPLWFDIDAHSSQNCVIQESPKHSGGTTYESVIFTLDTATFTVIEGVDPEPDTDGDGVFDDVDNCVDDPNPDQANLDCLLFGACDDVGDLCDPDDDKDTHPDALDNCPIDPNPTQADRDWDGLGDACDVSFDTGSVIDALESSAANSIALLTTAQPPGVNGLVAKLTGKGGVLRKVVEGRLQDASTQLDDYIAQLRAKVASGELGAVASDLQAEAAALRAQLDALLAGG